MKKPILIAGPCVIESQECLSEVAEELGISRRTLRDRKDSAMKELGDKLKDYK